MFLISSILLNKTFLLSLIWVGENALLTLLFDDCDTDNDCDISTKWFSIVETFVLKFSSFDLAEPKNTWFEKCLKSILRFWYWFSTLLLIKLNCSSDIEDVVINSL